MQDGLLNYFQSIMQWIVAPTAAFVWLIYNRQQTHATEIAVLKANADSAKEFQEREMKEIRDTTRAIMQKLDSIEQAMRK